MTVASVSGKTGCVL